MIYELAKEVYEQMLLLPENPPELTPAVLSEVNFAFEMVREELDPKLKLDRYRLIANAFQQVLPKIASDTWFFQALTKEKFVTKKEKTPWTTRFPEIEIESLIVEYNHDTGKFKNSGNKNLARECLLNLYDERHHRQRSNSFADHMRRVYLLWVSILTPVLFFIVVGLIWILDIKYGTDIPPLHAQLSLLAVSGALGATIGRAIKVRTLQECTGLKDMGRTFVSQLLIGAVLACFVFLVLKVQWITIPHIAFEQDTATELLIVGFIAGFSEPFSLNILERISRGGTDTTDAST